jgi:aminopeptidase-like protein
MGRLSRGTHDTYPQYHTSADNPDALSPDALAESWLACLKIFEALEAERRFVNLQPKCEPQLGRRGLYRASGGYYTGVADRQMALFWMLNQSDGRTSLLDIAEKSTLPVGMLAQAASDLQAHDLLAPADADDLP